MGYSPWGHKESDTTEQLHFNFLSKQISTHAFCICIYTLFFLNCAGFNCLFPSKSQLGRTFLGMRLQVETRSAWSSVPPLSFQRWGSCVVF